MRIAIPVSQGKLAAHFGHCEGFHLVDVENETKQILEQQEVASPPHQPGLLPTWLADLGVGVVLAGGIGTRAIQAFAERGIEVVAGVLPDSPAELVREYLAGALQSGGNTCDH